MDARVESAQTNKPSGGLFSRVATDFLFRRRLMNTVFVVWMFITLGWMAAVVGSVFPDLRTIIHKDLDTASWLFTDGAIGYLIGALVFGILFDSDVGNIPCKCPCHKYGTNVCPFCGPAWQRWWPQNSGSPTDTSGFVGVAFTKSPQSPSTGGSRKAAGVTSLGVYPAPKTGHELRDIKISWISGYYGDWVDRVLISIGYNRLILLTTVTSLCAVTFAVIPWCESFALMLVVNFFNGVFSGGIDVGGNTHVASMWGRESAPYMQAIHFGFSVGGILSPLTAEPFVAEKQCTPPPGLNHSSPTPEYSTSSALEVTLTVIPTSTECSEEYGQTHIQYAYLIGAIVALTAAIPFLLTNKVLRQRQSDVQKTDGVSVDVTGTPRDKLPDLSFKLKCVLVFLLMLLISLYAAVEGRFSSLLSSFVVEYLDWSKADSLHLSSLFWGAFAAGRFIGIGVAKVLKPASMILIYLIALMASFAGFLLAAEFKVRVVIWVCTATVGLSMSSIFPCIFTWTAESILVVTGKISAVYLVGVSIFNSILPLLYGYLMDNLNQMYFPYLLLGQSIISFLVYVIIRFLTNAFVK